MVAEFSAAHGSRQGNERGDHQHIRLVAHYLQQARVAHAESPVKHIGNAQVQRQLNECEQQRFKQQRNILAQVLEVVVELVDLPGKVNAPFHGVLDDVHFRQQGNKRVCDFQRSFPEQCDTEQEYDHRSIDDETHDNKGHKSLLSEVVAEVAEPHREREYRVPSQHELIHDKPAEQRSQPAPQRYAEFDEVVSLHGLPTGSGRRYAVEILPDYRDEPAVPEFHLRVHGFKHDVYSCGFAEPVAHHKKHAYHKRALVDLRQCSDHIVDTVHKNKVDYHDNKGYSAYHKIERFAFFLFFHI